MNILYIQRGRLAVSDQVVILTLVDIEWIMIIGNCSIYLVISASEPD